MNNDLEQIKNFIKDFFQKASFLIEAETKRDSGILSINIKTDEPQILIGDNGQTLLAIQHLLKIILKRKFPSFTEGATKSFYFDLDINNYKQKKIQYLEELARTVADEVALVKKEKELVCMPAYQRKVIHLALINRSDVLTKSIGEEPNRRVVIYPKNSII